MNIGFVGIGKMGFPVSLSFAIKGFNVYAYDKDPGRLSRYKTGDFEGIQEHGIEKIYESVSDRYRLCDTLNEVVDNCDMIFVAVQTPHSFGLDGSVPDMHQKAEDFNYEYLEQSFFEIGESLKRLKEKHLTIVNMSTVLPGTTDRIKAIFESNFTLTDISVNIVYSPVFIAMGTAVSDALEPEFSLVGIDYNNAKYWDVVQFYEKLGRNNIRVMSYESAELAKMMYNTFIGMKIIFANTVMELCDKIDGADSHDVLGAIKLGSNRITSDKYLSAGLGDGGPCHPRDNIALAWLSNNYLDYNIFYDVMEVRQRQSEYICRLIEKEYNNSGLEVAILGSSYKPGVDIRDGSPSILIERLLNQKFDIHPFMMDDADDINNAGIFLVGTRDSKWMTAKFAAGSVVIDPHGIIPVDDNIKIIRVGNRV